MPTVSRRWSLRPGPLAEVYGYFRNFANLPTFMENVVRIDVHDERRSHWVVKAPGGGVVPATQLQAASLAALGDLFAVVARRQAEIPD